MFDFERFRSDRRAIEGLPVRLVIAMVVGVASLGIMLNMLTGIQGLAVVELDARPLPEVTAPGNQSVAVTVVDPDGTPVSDATVIARSGTARLEGVVVARANESGVAVLDIAPKLGPNQVEGTVEIGIKPPTSGGYVDRRENTAVLVIGG